ncbi:MAG TPA: hypothetical protein PKH07_08125 [bacterium]|nr:hypothetical protein [bacterium]
MALTLEARSTLGKLPTCATGYTATHPSLFPVRPVIAQYPSSRKSDIASARIAGVDLEVSWNFKHIVHFEKRAGYQGVNLIHGYPAIRAP